MLSIDESQRLSNLIIAVKKENEKILRESTDSKKKLTAEIDQIKVNYAKKITEYEEIISVLKKEKNFGHKRLREEFENNIKTVEEKHRNCLANLNRKEDLISKDQDGFENGLVLINESNGVVCRLRSKEEVESFIQTISFTVGFTNKEVSSPWLAINGNISDFQLSENRIQ